MRNTVGRNNVFYMHLTLLPYISASEELKTKPTQHSVKELRSIGIQPDALVCRSDAEVTTGIREKLSLFCDVATEAVFPMPTVNNVYEVPLVMDHFGVGRCLSETLGLNGASQLDRGGREICRVPRLVHVVREALRQRRGILRFAGGRALGSIPKQSSGTARDATWADASGIVVPGGFGPRGVEGMIDTSRYARNKHVPYLGLCLGMQVMVIDWARDVTGLKHANSTELDPDCEHPVIDIMHGQRTITDLGGTMRLGHYPCQPQNNTRTADAYARSEIRERHRHRYEVNNTYRECLEASGMVMSGLSPTENWLKQRKCRTIRSWSAYSSIPNSSRDRTAPTPCSAR
ncbi:CTP synthase [Geodia barretti]|uniref:CTP synthase n=1 Tax=Geodia barretti TaxID=519541 RepID=A0AA35SZX2_GEOBA|nr:CTP synthase [Geodia barretti]